MRGEGGGGGGGRRRGQGVYLCDPDEDLELVDVELLFRPFGEPGPQQVHGGSVPLLKHINTTLSSKTHTHTRPQDVGATKYKYIYVTYMTPSPKTFTS